jgi:hypothetical protein
LTADGVTVASELLFEEHEVENYFGITASQLRTAISSYLAKAEYGVLNARRVRMWSPMNVLKVFIAHTLSEFSSVQFGVACETYSYTPESVWETVAKTAFSEAEPTPEFRVVLSIFNRRYFLAQIDDEPPYTVGRVETDDKGRRYFVSDRSLTSTVPSDRIITVMRYDLQQSALMFRELYRKWLENRPEN